MTNTEVLSKSLDECIDELVNTYASPEVPQIFADQITHSTEHGEVPAFAVPNPLLSANVPKIQGLIHHFHVPFIGNRNFFFYQPNHWSGNFPGVEVRATELVVSLGGSWLTPQIIEAAVEKHVALIGQALDAFRADADRFKENLPGRLRTPLLKRRQTAEAELQTASALKYPMNKVGNAPETYRLPVSPKRIAPAPSKPPTPAAEVEFTLSESDYQEILRICTSMSLVMERSPTVFEKAEEEHIRVHYLVQLNGQFQGAATGETFNNIGQTDILIRHQNKNVFIAECKFWGGYESLSKTVTQLLGYVTWRDTKTALIIFRAPRTMTFSARA